MLLLKLKVNLLQKLWLNILKASIQTELKGPVDNLVLLNEFFNIYAKGKKLHCLKWLPFRQLQRETIVGHIKWNYFAVPLQRQWQEDILKTVILKIPEVF